jgi:hypothetical protein
MGYGVFRRPPHLNQAAPRQHPARVVATLTQRDTWVWVGFPTPISAPSGQEEFAVLVRRTATGAVDPQVRIELWENGVFRATALANTTVSSTTGVVVRGVWDASSLTTADGSNVECYVYGTTSSDGARVEIGAIEWNDTPTAGGTPHSRTPSDSVSVTDSAQRTATYQRSVSDTAAVADSAQRTVTYSRSVADSVAVADSAARTAGYQRPVSDSASVADTANRSQGYGRSVSDSAAVADNANRTAAYTRSVSDSVAVADSAQRSQGYGRTQSDSASVTDSAQRSTTTLRSVSDSISVADARQVLVGELRNISDSASVADSAQRVATYQRTVSDSVAVADSAVDSQGYGRTVSDSVAVADSATPNLSQIENRTPSDSVAVADSAQRTATYARSVSDSASLADAAVDSQGYGRSVSDSASVADSAAKTQGHIRGVSDSVSVADSVHRFLTHSELLVSFPTPASPPSAQEEFAIQVRRTAIGATNPTVRIELWENGTFRATALADTAVTSTTGQVLRGAWSASSLTVADGSGVECYIYTTASANGAQVEIGAVEWNDTVAGGNEFSRTPSDSVSVADNVSRTVTYVRNVGPIMPGDTREIAYFGSLTIDELMKLESVALTDSRNAQITGGQNFSRTPSDSVSVADTRSLARGLSVTETLTITDATSRPTTYLRGASDTAGVTDSRSVFVGQLRTISDAVVVADARTRLASYIRAAQDSLVVNDSATRVVAYLRLRSEPSLSVADALLTDLAESIQRSRADSIAVSDLVAPTLIPLVVSTQRGVTVLAIPSATLEIVINPDALTGVLSVPEAELELVGG